MSHVTVIRVYMTRIAKQHNELSINILLLLLLILSIYLGMCPSVPTHVHPYMSKLRLLLETNDQTNRLCKQWVVFTLDPVHIQDHSPECFVVGVTETAARRTRDGFYCMPI